MSTETQTLDISQLSAANRAALMAQLEAESKADKIQQKEDRKAYKELTYEFVERNIDSLMHHNDITGVIIEKLFKDYTPIEDLKKQVYGNEQQDSHTSTLSDGSASITIGHNVSINFDGTESSGVQKIRDFIASLSDESADANTKKLVKMVDTFLKLNPKTGMLNPSKIIELSKLRDEFDDAQFDDGLDIIFNAQIRVQNSMYVSGWSVQQVAGVPKKLTFRFSV
ncbi:MAG: hypothetical protein ACOH2D_11755 [Gelidibacter sp.]